MPNFKNIRLVTIWFFQRLIRGFDDRAWLDYKGNFMSFFINDLKFFLKMLPKGELSKEVTFIIGVFSNPERKDNELYIALRYFFKNFHIFIRGVSKRRLYNNLIHPLELLRVSVTHYPEKTFRKYDLIKEGMEEFAIRGLWRRIISSMLEAFKYQIKNKESVPPYGIRKGFDNFIIFFKDLCS